MRSLVPPRSNSTSLSTRLLQFAFCVIFTSLMTYASVHKGWWLHINTPLAFAGGATALTLGYTTYMVWRKPLTFDQTITNLINPNYSRARYNAMLYFFMGWEILAIGVWLGALVCMWLPKGKDFRMLFVAPPYGVWIGANVMAASLAITFMWSTYMVFRERDSGIYHEGNLVTLHLTPWESNSPYSRV